MATLKVLSISLRVCNQVPDSSLKLLRDELRPSHLRHYIVDTVEASHIFCMHAAILVGGGLA